MGLKFSSGSQATWHLEESQIKARERARVDHVDFGPPDLDHMHVTNSQLSITLVKSDGHDLISLSANYRATRGCIWTLR